jgi:hypothetical protein
LAYFVGFIVIPKNILHSDSATVTSSVCSKCVRLLSLDALVEDCDSELPVYNSEGDCDSELLVYNSEGVVISFCEEGELKCVLHCDRRHKEFG